eukprot:NODE_297_length_1691_cov_301.372861.p1 GENE.NODE_297_length_1691_cov_301.372861~~NODE_297_length_1691_cov_301.372861.p1  ORF type:complete len:456 (-),score=119.60 NODE_297_length_1691_cov_301.372861:161-1528(-)
MADFRSLRRANTSGVAVEPSSDAIEQMQRDGTYDLYVKWQSGYEARAARQGRSSVQSAAEEEEDCDLHPAMVTEAALMDGTWRHVPEFIYPTCRVFNFHRTASYWIATFFLEGSALFTITCFLGILQKEGGSKQWTKELGDLPNFLACVMFLIGSYLSYFQIINLEHKDADDTYVCWSCSLSKMLQHSESWLSVGACFSYLIGSVLFMFAYTVPFCNPSSEQTLWLSTVPNTVGSILFTVGAVMECLVNDFYSHPRWRGATFWVCQSFVAGGILFTVPNMAACFGSDSILWVHIPFTVGSAAYTVGSLLCFCLYRESQIGLAQLPVLNRVPTAAPDIKLSFSTRGIFFQLIYAVMGSFALCDLCFVRALSLVNGEVPDSFLRACANWFIEGGTFIFTHLIFVLGSAVTRVPHEQPWRCILLTFRFIAVIFGLGAALRFVYGCHVLLYGSTPIDVA